MVRNNITGATRTFGRTSGTLTAGLESGFLYPAGRRMVAGTPDLHMSFVDADPADANRLAEDLSEALHDELPSTGVTRVRDDPLSQDFGATLAIVLGSTAVTALAKGVAAWLARRQDARIKLSRTTADGETIEVVVEGQATARTERLVTEFLSR